MISAALIICAAVLAALVITNKTPNQLFYSVVRELSRAAAKCGINLPRLRLWLILHDPKRIHRSPYARITDNPDHSPLLLSIPTSMRDAEAAHPDVLYVRDGWGAENKKWLMAATPYPHGEDLFENPEFYVSDDGLRWTVPKGLHNPIASVPLLPERTGVRSEFHSDASLMLDGGELFLYYRYTALLEKGITENKIILTRSSDGIEWGEHKTVLEERTAKGHDRKFLSPSVMKMRGKYFMWTVEYEDGRRFIFRREGDSPLSFGPPVKCSLDEKDVMAPPWHLDVTESGAGLRMLLTTAAERGYEAELRECVSDCEGLEWRVVGRPFTPSYAFEARRLYRASLVQDGEGSDRIYYSALSENGTWNIAVVSRHSNDVNTFDQPRE